MNFTSRSINSLDLDLNFLLGLTDSDFSFFESNDTWEIFIENGNLALSVSSWQSRFIIRVDKLNVENS